MRYRVYHISALRGTSSVPEIIVVSALGVAEAFKKVNEQGAWPLAVVMSRWDHTSSNT